MKRTPSNFYTAKLGLTAILAGGACGVLTLNTNSSSHIVSEDMTDDERARAELLHVFYEAVRDGILQHSSEELASVLEPMRYGIKAKRMCVPGDYSGASGKVHLYVKGEREPDNYLRSSLSVNLEPLIGGLEKLRKQNIPPPSTKEVKDVFLQAVYSALTDKKYKDMELEGMNAQKYLRSSLFGAWVKKTIFQEVTQLVDLHIPEVEDAQHRQIASSDIAR